LSASQPSNGDTIITTLSIYLHPASVPSKALLYDVTVDAPDGEIIVQGERDPEHVAARVLKNRSLGNRPLHVFAPSLTAPGKWTPTLRYRKVSDAASKHTRESTLAGPVAVSYREFEIAGKAA
jgi:hypothetical protein